MELYDFVLECLSDSDILDDWTPSDKMQQKASNIVTEYLSEPDYREKLAEQIVESIDAGCYENGVFFEALNYEPYLSSGFNDGCSDATQYDEHYRGQAWITYRIVGESDEGTWMAEISDMRKRKRDELVECVEEIFNVLTDRLVNGYYDWQDHNL